MEVKDLTHKCVVSMADQWQVDLKVAINTDNIIFVYIHLVTMTQFHELIVSATNETEENDSSHITPWFTLNNAFHAIHRK
jgi:hypothetical protein